MGRVGDGCIRKVLVVSTGMILFSLTACGMYEKDMAVTAYNYDELMQPLSDETLNAAATEQDVVNAQEDLSQPTETIMPDSADDGVVTVTISAAGDVTLGNYLGQDYSGSFDQIYDLADDEGYFFQNVYDIFSSDDFTVVNLEGPLTTAEEIRQEKEYVIKGSPAYAALLKFGSIEGVGLANNHILDYKEQGLADTVAAVEEQDIEYAYDNNVGIYEVKGIRIGFLAISQVSRGNAMEVTIKKSIEKLKEEEADIILVLCHWGIEREFYPEEYQQYLGHLCIDWGADVVLGSHPHVIQGIEEYNGKYIVYSMGNFCFGGNRNPSDKDSMIFQQTYTFIDGTKQENTDIRVIPCSISSVSDRNNYQPTPLTGSEGERVIDRLNLYSSDFGIEFDYDGYLK
jgi:poly-gamma-glutamate synthesis protein (capsule biosynthesis protein)